MSIKEWASDELESDMLFPDQAEDHFYEPELTSPISTSRGSGESIKFEEAMEVDIDLQEQRRTRSR